MALFSGSNSNAPRPGNSIKPPPPPRPATSFFDDDEDKTTAMAAPVKVNFKRPSGVRFDAELDMCELDDRDRPGPVWTARGRELSRSHLLVRTRRMCYAGRRVLVAVHLIDDLPVPLFGKVINCDYDVDGLYKVELELLRVPDRPEIAIWMNQRARGREQARSA
jgi:hypothetical protein